MLTNILEDLKSYNANLVAVSKTKSVVDILNIYNKGQRIFGENRVQEMAEKKDLLPDDIEWHMIGHLQKNKVKYMASFVHTIHSIDSLELLKAINKGAEKHHRVINILFQLKIATEESKFGMSLEDCLSVINSEDMKSLNNVIVSGVMGMATFTEDKEKVRNEFKTLKASFDYLKENYFLEDSNFKEISMGMSGDYHLALKEGSTMVRIGSLIFGARN